MDSLQAALVSMTGDRKDNQDRVMVEVHPDTILLVVADGLGGHPRGEVAAQMLIDGAKHLFQQAAKPLPDPEQFMQACITYAHNAIVRYGNMQSPVISPRTTAVIAVIQNGRAYWLHVGDSRLYLMRGKKIVARTKDHSVAQMMDTMISSGHNIPKKRYRNAVTRCLGGMDFEPSSTVSEPHKLQPGDVLILCTDGFWGQLKEQKIINQLAKPISLESALNSLCEQAVKAATPNSDNVTIAALFYADNETDADYNEHQIKSGDKELDSAVKHLLGMIHQTNKKSS